MKFLSRNRVGAVVALLTAVCLSASPAESFASIQFELDSFSVSTHSAGPGLLINTDSSVISPTLESFSLDVGQSVTGDLFRIWTDEAAWNLDDASPQNASVSFNFSQPAPTFGGGVSGETYGATIFFASGGVLDWNNGPFILSFGPNGDGKLQVTLSDEVFNPGPGFTFRSGRDYGATVEATFTLLQAPAVPEPATLLLWGGLGLAGVAAGRRFVA
ncbi:PEP-CTERM sorting domain-containing protein [Lacipirellula limnantheis]|uniref:Ice-binding protein C-terminal domain-containing protein n=1 Tax=Lacipirellula limnantheis TaxID=2528024 RepID=A0A517TYA8_9BACT|nr:PEP-CTERM sorting domain-containing protein [Lacipirellula limnantheis]QDT73363.1 hypothetical protein I41_25520 [Lacipirellula limnantheis]